jgi:hypothetical protein
VGDVAAALLETGRARQVLGLDPVFDGERDTMQRPCMLAFRQDAVGGAGLREGRLAPELHDSAKVRVYSGDAFQVGADDFLARSRPRSDQACQLTRGEFPQASHERSLARP